MIHHHRLHSSRHDWALDSWQLWPVPLLITPAAIRGSDRWQYKDDDRSQFLQFQLLHYHYYKLYVYYNCCQQSPGFRRQTKLGPNTALARWPLITATNWDLGPWSPLNIHSILVTKKMMKMIIFHQHFDSGTFVYWFLYWILLIFCEESWETKGPRLQCTIHRSDPPAQIKYTLKVSCNLVFEQLLCDAHCLKLSPLNSKGLRPFLLMYL